MPDPQNTNAWRQLLQHRAKMRRIHPRQLFKQNPRRFQEFSLQLDDLLFDFSKTALAEETAKLLLQLAKETQVARKRRAMFDGKPVNSGENRPALHHALRAPKNLKISSGGKNIAPAVHSALEKMLNRAEEFRRGTAPAANGKPFSHIVHIGAGGAVLGAKTAAAALPDFHDGPQLRFAENADGDSLGDALAGLDPRQTLVFVASKSFQTAETLQNARRAKQWLAAQIPNPAQHVAAATAQPEKAKEFGAGTVFPWQHWLGGRFSVWGAAGFSTALAIGKKHFTDFLAGARQMDEHFCNAPPRQNIPLMLGMLGIWHRNICGYPTRAVLPYSRRLRLLPEYLQQLDMESNGKNINRNGEPVKIKTAPAVWGGEGTCAQHSFFQMLHQGTDVAPCEFILAARGKNKNAQKMLAANCLAQSAALFLGGEFPESSESHEPQLKFPGG